MKNKVIADLSKTIDENGIVERWDRILRLLEKSLSGNSMIDEENGINKVFKSLHCEDDQKQQINKSGFEAHLKGGQEDH